MALGVCMMHLLLPTRMVRMTAPHVYFTPLVVADVNCIAVGVRDVPAHIYVN